MRSCTKAPTPYEFKCTLKNRSDCRWQCVRVCVCGLCAVFRQHLVVQGHVRERGKKKKKWESTVGQTGMRPRPTPSRHTHTEIYLHTCTHALLHTRPPRAEPSGQLQPSGAAQGKRGGGGWVGEIVEEGLRCTEGERRRGGGEAAGSALGGQCRCSQACKRASHAPPPAFLSSFLTYSLSLSLPFHRPLSLQLFLCVCTPTEVTTGELYRQVTTVAFLPPTNMGGKKRGKYK